MSLAAVPAGAHVVCKGQKWEPGDEVHPCGGSRPFRFVTANVIPASSKCAYLGAAEVHRALCCLGMRPLALSVVPDTVPGSQSPKDQTGDELVLEVFDCGSKGCGVRPCRAINTGEAVCDYAGEILSSAEAEQRQRAYDQKKGMNYLLVLREHLPDRIVRTPIDPTHIGGVARCINHSCRPNLQATVVRVGSIVPTVRFYAARRIEAGEELTFDYGGLFGTSPDIHVGRTQCLCGESNCRGFLPFNPSEN